MLTALELFHTELATAWIAIPVADGRPPITGMLAGMTRWGGGGDGLLTVSLTHPGGHTTLHVLHADTPVELL